jgi:ring-1,2-phenylacetyl-CoA epoxidase subunit PaaC
VSRQLTQTAVDELWMYTGEVFIYDAVDEAMAAEGIAPPSAALREQWLAHVSDILGEATLAMPPADAWMQKGGKQGRHSEHLGYLLAEMQFLQRAYPDSEW